MHPLTLITLVDVASVPLVDFGNSSALKKEQNNTALDALFLQLNGGIQITLFAREETQSIHPLLVKNAETSLSSDKQDPWRSILPCQPLGVSAVNGNYRQMVLKRETITKEKEGGKHLSLYKESDGCCRAF